MEQLCGKSGKADNAGFSNTGLHVRLAFAGPVSSARRSAVARSSSEPCPPSGFKTLPAIAAHRGRWRGSRYAPSRCYKRRQRGNSK